MNIQQILRATAVTVMLIGCSEDDDNGTTTLDAGTLTGGPFEITVDGTSDMISGIAHTDFDR